MMTIIILHRYYNFRSWLINYYSKLFFVSLLVCEKNLIDNSNLQTNYAYYYFFDYLIIHTHITTIVTSLRPHTHHYYNYYNYYLFESPIVPLIYHLINYYYWLLIFRIPETWRISLFWSKSLSLSLTQFWLIWSTRSNYLILTFWLCILLCHLMRSVVFFGSTKLLTPPLGTTLVSASCAFHCCHWFASFDLKCTSAHFVADLWTEQKFLLHCVISFLCVCVSHLELTTYYLQLESHLWPHQRTLIDHSRWLA